MIIEFSPSSITRWICSRNCGELVRVLRLPVKFIRFCDVEGASRCGFIGIGHVCLPLGTAEADVEWWSVKRAAGGEL